MTALIIGIDPGSDTGFAVWFPDEQRLTFVASMKIHEAMRRVEKMQRAGLLKMVVYEDARLRTWFGNKGREALQGAGSIKRECGIWADYLASLGCPYLAVKPTKGATKWDAKQFARVTGWTGRTNEHSRDAACLVIGRK